MPTTPSTADPSFVRLNNHSMPMSEPGTAWNADGVPVFHILGDDSTLLKVGKAGLQRSLQELQSVNPGMKVVFDFRSSGRTP